MRYILTFAALFFTLSSFGQGIWNKAATNNIWNRTKADSVLIIPRDTTPTNGAFYLGAPVGDYGRVAIKDSSLYYYRGNQWKKLITDVGDIGPAVRGTLLTGLLTGLPDPIQPTDSILMAFAKIQAQINYQYGSFFKYNEVNPAQLIVQNPNAGRSIVIQKMGLGLNGDTTAGILGFRTTGGRDIGYIGLAKNLPSDTNSIDFLNAVGRTIITASDTTATIFATWTGAAQNHYTFFKSGKWRMYNTAPVSIWNDPAHTSTLEIKGSFAPNIRNSSVGTTLTAEDHTVVVNNTGPATVALPPAASVPGRVHCVMKISAAGNDVIIDPNGGELINGVTSKTLTLQWSSVIIQSNGLSWMIISSSANATIL